MNWYQLQDIKSADYVCGFCDNLVASAKGYAANNHSDSNRSWFVRICPHCERPTFFHPKQGRTPASKSGGKVYSLPVDVETLYDEARNAIAASCNTGAVLLCRKLLAHIAVEQGAKEGLSFLKYVEHLSDKGFIPPNGKHWVDHIRLKGNEANHEIVIMSESDASEIISFVEMLLKFVFEFPNRVPVPIPVVPT